MGELWRELRFGEGSDGNIYSEEKGCRGGISWGRKGKLSLKCGEMEKIQKCEIYGNICLIFEKL